MKYFVILAVIVGGYYFVMLATANIVLDQTQALQQQYSHVAQQADQIAAGATFSNR